METPTLKTPTTYGNKPNGVTDVSGADAHGMKLASISEAIALHKLGVLSIKELHKIVEKLISKDDDVDTPPLPPTKRTPPLVSQLVPTKRTVDFSDTTPKVVSPTKKKGFVTPRNN